MRVASLIQRWNTDTLTNMAFASIPEQRCEGWIVFCLKAIKDNA